MVGAPAAAAGNRKEAFVEDEARVTGMRAEQDEPEVEAHMRRENEEPAEEGDSEADRNAEPDVEAHMRRAGPGRNVGRNVN
jgi:hypothetical protein